MTNDLKANAIRANLDALKALLEEASSRVGEATAYADAGESMNAIIGPSTRAAVFSPGVSANFRK